MGHRLHCRWGFHPRRLFDGRNPGLERRLGSAYTSGGTPMAGDIGHQWTINRSGGSSRMEPNEWQPSGTWWTDLRQASANSRSQITASEKARLELNKIGTDLLAELAEPAPSPPPSARSENIPLRVQASPTNPEGAGGGPTAGHPPGAPGRRTCSRSTRSTSRDAPMVLECTPSWKGSAGGRGPPLAPSATKVDPPRAATKTSERAHRPQATRLRVPAQQRGEVGVARTAVQPHGHDEAQAPDSEGSA